MGERFLDRDIVFANATVGEAIEFESAMPANFAQIVSGASFASITIDGKLFVPPNRAGKPAPLVIIAPGSVGVAESHLMHAETLCDHGYAAFVIDPFGARSVASTVANQTQFSFAASAYDVLAAAKVLAQRPEIDATRIGVQGHSRGGAAVISAAMAPMRAQVLGSQVDLRAVYAVYPWAGQQFVNPDIGDISMRIVIGDQDNWCSPQQVQGYAQAIRLAGGNVTMRMFADAHHSFDRRQGLEDAPEAVVAPHAPTIYIDDAGAFIHPVTGESDPTKGDLDFMAYAVNAGFLVTGATMGSKEDQADLFRADMLAFWDKALA